MEPSKLHLRRLIQHDEVGMGNNQFRCFYMAFHPMNDAFVVHEGHSGKVFMDGKLIYSYSLIGRPPRAGGDTHGAITWSQDLVFIGGWIKAPPGLLVSTDRTLSKQDMRNKYSHIHTVDENGKVELLWSRKWDENLPPNHWYGEVTDLLYDGHEDILYFSRADGYAELGLWRIFLSDRKAEWLIKNRTVYKMELKDDKIFATLFNPAHMENSAIAIYDTVNGESKLVEEFNFALDPGKKISMKRDGGQIIQLQNKLIAFYGGAMIVVDPYKNEYMLYPFLEVVGPEFHRPAYIPGLRTQKVYPLGLPLIAVNPSEGLTEPTLRTTVGLLIRVDPVIPQIVTSTGFVSGMISDGENIYLGASYANHCPAYTYRTGDGGIYAVPLKEFFTKPWSSIRLWVFDGLYKYGETGVAGWFGGIPLKGFTTKKLRVYVTKEVKMKVAEYNLLSKIAEDDVSLNSGWNIIELSSYYDAVAFRFKDDLDKALAEIVLEP
ncbi:MAG: DUF2139 domain-containing protein [Ignisphaera sp.]